jgi:hypothetical protein
MEFKLCYNYDDVVAAGWDLTKVAPTIVTSDSDEAGRRRRYRDVAVRAAVDWTEALVSLAISKMERPRAHHRR